MTKKTSKTDITQNEIFITPPGKGEEFSLNQVISTAVEGSLIKLANGEYLLSNPILIDKPLKLIAKTAGEVRITGEDLPNLLIFTGNGKLILSGIKFSMENQNPTNVIVINSGDLEMDQCIIEGGRDPKILKRDFGAGLILLGTSSATVSNSVFKNNMLGISVQGKSSVMLVSNKFTENGYGIVFRDKSNSNLSANEYYLNIAYGLIAYDESELSISRDICHNNKAGFGFINKSKAKVESTTSYENEYHGFFIDNDADCVLKNNQSYSNVMSGIAIYGDSHTLMEENELYKNSYHGFEIAENAKSTLRNNKIYGNPNGIYLGNTATVNIEENEIYENGTGISINDEALATIENNKIFKNSGEAIDDSSEKNSTIGDNEVHDNNAEMQDDENEEIDDESGESSLGDFFAKMLGTENMSNDPNVIAIPLGEEIGKSKSENENDDDVDVVSWDQLTSFISSVTNDPIQIYYSLIGDGDDFRRNGKLKEAQEAYKKAIEKIRNEPTAYVRLSLVSFMENDMPEVVSYLNEAILVEQYHKDLCLLRSCILQWTEESEDALSDFLKAIRASLDGEFEEGVLSHSHSENNQLAIAIEDFAGGLRFRETNDTTVFIQGVLNIIISSADFFEKEKDFVDPIELFTKAIQIDSGNAVYYWARGLVQETYQDKIDDFSQALTLMSDSAEAFYIRGYCKLLNSDIKGAIQDFDKVKEIAPDNIKTYEKLGLYYYYKVKKYDQAIAVFSSGIDQNPSSPDLYFLRGLVFEHNGDFNSAILNFQKYVDLCGVNTNSPYLSLENTCEHIKEIKAKHNL
ncbi:MAG: right-handed parallel beta-helix repeat-containing protein [Anaerolineaceae bacterium]